MNSLDAATLDKLNLPFLNKLNSISVGDITLFKIIYVVLLIVVLLVLARVLVKGTARAIGRSKIELRFHKIITSGIKFILYFIIAIIVAGSLNIPISSLVALVSVAGAAVALAAQDVLSNVFDGMILLTAHPYKLGDYIDTGAHSGFVVETGLFYTKLRTFDNRVVFISNSDIFSNRVVNYSSEALRRITHEITAAYDASTKDVQSALMEAAHMTKGIIWEEGDHYPTARVSEFADYGVKYALRVWVETPAYWDVYYDLLENVREVFKTRSIEIPYPKFDLNLKARS